jgi:hypothetical protein
MGETMVIARAFFPRAAAAAWQRKELSTPPEKATAAFPREEIRSISRRYFSSISVDRGGELEIAVSGKVFLRDKYKQERLFQNLSLWDKLEEFPKNLS